MNSTSKWKSGGILIAWKFRKKPKKWQREITVNMGHLCFALCLGDEKDVIYGVDNRKVAVEDLMSEFKSTNCKSLENKPKLFFIQACRGKRSDPRLSRLSVSTENIAEDGMQTMDSPDADIANGISAREADFLLAFATVPGYKAWRSKQAGSWFIQVCFNMCLSGWNLS